jgi:hypothetical protein
MKEPAVEKSDIIEHVAGLTEVEFYDFQKQVNLARWAHTHKLPAEMEEWFRGGISKHLGDMWENKYVAACSSLGPKTSGDHDATLDASIVQAQQLRGATVEIKFFTCMTKDSAKDIEKRKRSLSWGERALRMTRDDTVKHGWRLSTKGTWQQVKPTCAHYGLFSALHGNGAMHYWIPYHLIQPAPGKKNLQPGMIPLGIQHRNHATEGQVDLNARIHELFFLDVTEGTPFLTDLSKYDLHRYETIRY